MNNILEVENLHIKYLDENSLVQALRGVSFSLEYGERLGIIGESGSGKTSIANAIMQILPKSSQLEGRILFESKDIGSLNSKERQDILWSQLAIIFQNSLDVLNPVLTIGKQIDEVLIEHKKSGKKEAKLRSIECLEMVGLEADIYDFFPHQLSGGMRQRALIAMAIACEPKLLIADELTSALDAKTKTDILDLLDRLQLELGFSLILISHELDTIARLTDRVLVLYKGEIMEEAGSRELLEKQIHPYSRGLIASSTAINVYKDLWGITPRISGNDSDGCPFYPRCTQRIDLCRKEKLKLSSLGPTRKVACHRGGIIELLSCNKVNKTFQNASKTVRACIDCSLNIRHGEFLSIIGKSGSGKTSLANCISGITDRDSGQISFLGESIDSKTMGSIFNGIQLVLQDPFSSINENFSVRDAIIEPLVINNLFSKDEIELRLNNCLEMVELSQAEEFKRKKIFTLSGGQRQRVALARALSMEPQLLIADEICSMLDKSTEANILRLLKGLQNQYGFAMIYITHNLSIALKISDSILVMNEGRIVEAGNPVKIMKNPEHKYTQELIHYNMKNEELLH